MENGVRVLERAMDVLSYMADLGRPARVSEIADGIGLSRATTYRILNTLRARNVVLQGEHSLYMLGPTPLYWAGAYQGRLVMEQIFRMKVTELWEMCRETIHLFSFERDRVYYVDKMDSPQAVMMRSRLGAWRDLYSTGGGRAVLGALPPKDRLAYLEKTPLVAHTVHTCTDVQQILERIERGNVRGFHEEVNENELGIRCVGAPILNASRVPVGSISVAAPAYRVDDALSEAIGRLTRTTADNITAELAHK